MNQDYIKEDIKKRPVNKSKILRKTLTTLALAVLFGVVASLIILVLEPFLEKITTTPEEPVPSIVSLPEDEMSPEAYGRRDSRARRGDRIRRASLKRRPGKCDPFENPHGCDELQTDDAVDVCLRKGSRKLCCQYYRSKIKRRLTQLRQ